MAGWGSATPAMPGLSGCLCNRAPMAMQLAGAHGPHSLTVAVPGSRWTPASRNHGPLQGGVCGLCDPGGGLAGAGPWNPRASCRDEQ